MYVFNVMDIFILRPQESVSMSSRKLPGSLPANVRFSGVSC